MPIEFNNINPNSVTANTTPQVTTENDAALPQQNTQTGQSSTTDTVSITDRAQRLQAAVDSLPELPVVDSQRVADVRQALSEGSYQIDPQQIAESILQFDNGIRE
ncbi:MAG: hypothetical protein Tsb005_09540 [Gammaproteobacteria bacterium]